MKGTFFTFEGNLHLLQRGDLFFGEWYWHLVLCRCRHDDFSLRIPTDQSSHGLCDPAAHSSRTHTKGLITNARFGINEYNGGMKEAMIWCAHIYCNIIEIPPVVTHCIHTHAPNWCVSIKQSAQIHLEAQAAPKRRLVPPEWCLHEAHFMTMMLFPDQCSSWNADRNGPGANKLLLNFKDQNRNFFGRPFRSTWVCI